MKRHFMGREGEFQGGSGEARKQIEEDESRQQMGTPEPIPHFSSYTSDVAGIGLRRPICYRCAYVNSIFSLPIARILLNSLPQQHAHVPYFHSMTACISLAGDKIRP